MRGARAHERLVVARRWRPIGRFIALEPAATAAGEEDAAAKTKKRGRRDAVSYDGGVCARFVGAAWRVVLVFACTLAVKLVLGLFATEDAHVFNLLKAKLGDYEDFDTAMCVGRMRMGVSV